MLMKSLNRSKFFLFRINHHSNILFSTTLSSSQKKEANKKNEDLDMKSLSTNLPVLYKPTIFNRFKEAFGYQGSHRYTQNSMAIAGVRLYLCIQKQIDYDQFFKVCESRDVFYSFCLVTYLHVWMVCVRLAEEGHSGKFVRNRLIEAMWKDVSERIKKMGTFKISVKKESTEALYDIFNACLFGFDEGLLSNDMGLAACLWRHLLEMKDIEDYSTLTTLCDYVRRNVSHLDNVKEIDMLKNGIVTFVTLGNDNVDHFKEREKLYKYILAIE
jgi:cytochrome b pre-mRNA-processing protein 3